MPDQTRLGGPCQLCGLPQVARLQGCQRSRADCPYGRDADPAVIKTLTALVPMPAPMRFARMLKLYIVTTEGLTQKQVAKESGVNESTLSRFLSGEQMPDGTAFAALLAWSLSTGATHA